jgi:hypothetical protein
MLPADLCMILFKQAGLQQLVKTDAIRSSSSYRSGYVRNMPVHFFKKDNK